MARQLKKLKYRLCTNGLRRREERIAARKAGVQKTQDKDITNVNFHDFVNTRGLFFDRLFGSRTLISQLPRR